MAEFSRNKDIDYRYRKYSRRHNEINLAVNVRKSILELRSIYGDYTDQEFAEWYGGRYGVRPEAILVVIRNRNAGETV
ncbi:hypothetical protein [Paenibacillus sp. GCM10027626]|uniref:hypothetical protein n=1 Tax=Paenibacillus sp. GCM10027626 TaxID=3273411 RepID=UPI003637594C